MFALTKILKTEMMNAKKQFLKDIKTLKSLDKLEKYNNKLVKTNLEIYNFTMIDKDLDFIKSVDYQVINDCI